MHSYLSNGNPSCTEVRISQMTCFGSKAPKWGEIFSNHDNNYCGTGTLTDVAGIYVVFSLPVSGSMVVLLT